MSLMRVLDKLLLFLYSLAVGVLAVLAAVAASGGIPRSWLLEGVGLATGDAGAVQATVIAVAVVLVLVSLRFFVLSVRAGGAVPPSINQRTDYGEIRISMETVENLALKAASRVRGAKDLKARVQVTESGLEVMIRAFADGEGSIPALSEEIQRTVAAHVEETTGIPVADVSVFIANIAQAPTTFKSRVE
jgi:uncharacterized alkaline shock family protein YloU